MAVRAILVGLDGSEHSAAAAELAISWAQRFHAVTGAIGVVDDPTIRSPQSEPVGGARIEDQLESEFVRKATNEVQSHLHDFADHCHQVGVQCELIKKSGRPFEQILLESQRYDVVLLGSKTYFHFEDERNPGKTINRVLKSSPRPVVVVPEWNTADKGILVAYDGSISAARALQFLVANGLHTLGDIHILSVDSSSRDGADDNTQRARDFLRFHKVACQVLPVVSNDDVGKIIVEKADRLGVEMIMMGAFGRTALAEMIFGSVTKHVVEHTPVPVFLAN